ncbi:hypothetical protein Esti_003763 [Eimeria stiedai]
MMLRCSREAATPRFLKYRRACLSETLEGFQGLVRFKLSRADVLLRRSSSCFPFYPVAHEASLGCTASADFPAKRDDLSRIRPRALKPPERIGEGGAPRSLLIGAADENLLCRQNMHVVCSWEQQVRCVSTASASRLRMWLASTGGPSSFWRQLLCWGPESSPGWLREVRLPLEGGIVKAVALGGWGVFAILNGRLVGVHLDMKNAFRGRPSSDLMLEEIREEPPEAAGVSQADFERHLRRSESEGVLLAWDIEEAASMDDRKQQRFVKVAAGLHHCAAITRHGLLYTWGRGGSWGAGSPLGHGDTKARLRPALVPQFLASGEFVVDVACGAASTCVVTSEEACNLLPYGSQTQLVCRSGSGRVLSSGAADFGLNGSGMLVSSKIFKEIESFRGVLTPGILELQRRNEESHLQQLEAMKEKLQQEGGATSRLVMRPFQASQAPPQDSPADSLPDASSRMHSHERGAHTAMPKVTCSAHHCGLLTPNGILWLWGRNDCLQLGQEKIVMASGGESNYPIVADFFTRSDVHLKSCAMGPGHSLAVARNGIVYEWGGTHATPPHPVDLHWRYPESVFKSSVVKVTCGGLKATSGFSAVLTKNGDAFFWGPGASLLPLALNVTEEKIPVRVDLTLFAGDSATGQRETTGIKVLDLAGGPQGCFIVTSHEHTHPA